MTQINTGLRFYPPGRDFLKRAELNKTGDENIIHRKGNQINVEPGSRTRKCCQEKVSVWPKKNQNINNNIEKMYMYIYGQRRKSWKQCINKVGKLFIVATSDEIAEPQL